MRAVKQVNSSVDVGALTTVGVLGQNVQMPQCFYEIRRERRDGPVINEAVGLDEKLFHYWQCDAKTGQLRFLLLQVFRKLPI